MNKLENSSPKGDKEIGIGPTVYKYPIAIQTIPTGMIQNELFDAKKISSNAATI